MAAEGKNITYADIPVWREAVMSVYDEYVPTLNAELAKPMFEQIGLEWTW